jgi:hypothetical protein
VGIFRQRRLPSEFAGFAELLLDGERLLAWAPGPARPDGTPTLVVATESALYPFGYTERIPWERVMRAAWDDPIQEVVTANDAGGIDVIRLALDDAGSIPQVIFERVMATIVMQRHVELESSGKLGATLVARRVRGGDEIRWEVVFDAGLDPRDSELRARADEELAALRASVGI